MIYALLNKSVNGDDDSNGNNSNNICHLLSAY